MKLIINVAIFIVVLIIPFALSSQIRKAIPAGRYESLSGIKVSHTKGENSIPSNQNIFWYEVGKNISNEISEVNYINDSKNNLNLKNLIQTKNFRLAKKDDHSLNLYITDDLKKEKILKTLNNKSLVVLITHAPLSEIANTISNYTLLMSQSNDNENYFLLKLK